MNVSDVLNRITDSKRSQGGLRAYVKAQDSVLGAKLDGCGTWLHCREWIQSGHTRLINANFCKQHLLCKACAVRRAWQYVQAYTPKVQSVMDQMALKCAAMVTLTVKNGPDLAERVAHLKASWKKMLEATRNGKSMSGRHSLVQWNRVAGSIRAMEVTRSDKGEWHPHFHVFVLLTDWIDHAEFVREWKHWTGDSSVVGVTKCKGEILPALLEVVKYSVKFKGMAPAESYQVHSTLKGSRLLDPQGVLRGVPEPDIDSDDITGLDGPTRDFIAKWLWSDQKYEIEWLPPVLTYRKIQPVQP